MNQGKRIQVFVIGILTVACLGVLVESIFRGWEFWVPPLLIVGIVCLWLMHIRQYMDEYQRENFYFIYAALLAFFNGVHEGVVFDLIAFSAMFMITFALLGRYMFLNILLVEYYILVGIQIALDYNNKSLELNRDTVLRLALHLVSAFVIYMISRRVIASERDNAHQLEASENQKKAYANDTEDFLTNISHELRTPVNVVNGMSTIILKNEQTDDVVAIRDAGLRLSRQIEDIQDYTEIKRGDLILEEEKYIITSVINDLLATFSVKNSELEFVVDLDPNVPTMMKGDIRKIHKIIRHLVDNAIKFTRKGGILVSITTIKREYGVNLEIEVTDTGIGMTRKDIANASKGLYQANKKRNRSTGGIGLGLNVVYGFVHKMDGFATITSKKGSGTTVRVSIPQEVVDITPCLRIDTKLAGNIVFHVSPEKYEVPEVRDFYRVMAMHMAEGLRLNLYSAVTVREIEGITEKIDVSHIFMGEEEYMANPLFFDELASLGIVVAVSAREGFKTNENSKVIIMPKPLYGYPVARILNEGTGNMDLSNDLDSTAINLKGVKCLIVDDEPMNLVVATGLFRNYGMITDTASSGQESIDKYAVNDYDVIFMDHMMPEMDGVEAMKRLKNLASDMGTNIRVVALTANAVSGAREMFMSEGFDGFISKPIDVAEFERVMKKVLPETESVTVGGGL
ncbi:MAG: response regulator [Lachnospiraceae bacterium]|nr:response regulator [Lachnospiraceae bacterium]